MRQIERCDCKNVGFRQVEKNTEYKIQRNNTRYVISIHDCPVCRETARTVSVLEYPNPSSSDLYSLYSTASEAVLLEHQGLFPWS